MHRQEEYCFDIAFDNEGASLLINTKEQMFAEKLRSLLKFGTFSTRYKDVYNMYYQCGRMDGNRPQWYNVHRCGRFLLLKGV